MFCFNECLSILFGIIGTYRHIRLKTPAEFVLVFLLNISHVNVAMAHDIADKAATTTCNNISSQTQVIYLINLTIQIDFTRWCPVLSWNRRVAERCILVGFGHIVLHHE